MSGKKQKFNKMGDSGLDSLVFCGIPSGVVMEESHKCKRKEEKWRKMKMVFRKSSSYGVVMMDVEENRDLFDGDLKWGMYEIVFF